VASLVLFASKSRSSAGEIVLTFDDIPAYTGNNIDDVIREQYSSLGVHFNDDGRAGGIVRAGISNGDPGNWKLEGTNGPNFLGQNIYGLTGIIDFDMPIYGFSVDAAEGNAPGLVDLVFDAYGPGGLLETETASSPVGIWTTIAFSTKSGITHIDFHSNSDYGLDNMRFSTTPLPEPSTWLLATIGAGGLWFVGRRPRVAKQLLQRTVMQSA